MKFDVLADWTLNFYCNFSCDYCFFAGDKRQKNKQFLGYKNVENVLSFFDKTSLVWLIHMSGGEPFLYPRFVEMCRGLTKKHYISINSNLSINTIYDFINKIDPGRVLFINASLHFQERLKKQPFKLFINKFRSLRKAGFTTFASQVFYPSLINGYDEMFKYFLANDIVVRPKAFRGVFNKKIYPEDYTESERNAFYKYSNLAKKLEPLSSSIHINTNLEDQFITGDLSFKGLGCDAGKKFVCIKYNGDVTRCHASNEKIGNIFEGKLQLLKGGLPCFYTVCPCPYYGLKYAKGQPKITKTPRLQKILKTNRTINKIKKIYRSYLKRSI